MKFEYHAIIIILHHDIDKSDTHYKRQNGNQSITRIFDSNQNPYDADDIVNAVFLESKITRHSFAIAKSFKIFKMQGGHHK